MHDLFSEQQLQDVDFFTKTEHPSEGRLRATRSPFWVEGVDEFPDIPAPGLAIASAQLTLLTGIQSEIFSNENLRAYDFINTKSQHFALLTPN